MNPSFWQIVLSVVLFGILVHALLAGQYVARHEPRTNERAVVWVIFFSGMWFIGPFVYFGFRNSRPLLARACLRQAIAVTVLWMALLLLSSAGVDLWGAGSTVGK